MNQRVVVLGSKDLCVDVVRLLSAKDDLDVAIVVTMDDSGDSRSRLPELRDLCESFDIPFLAATTTAEANGAVRATRADLGVVAGWYRLIPADVLATATHGFFGIHFSLLPQYRGSAPVVWALLNGESEIGYSIFEIVEGMDEGRLAGQGRLVVPEGGYIREVLDGLSRASVSHLGEVVSRLAEGNIALQHQSGPVSYSGARHPSDGAIDWSLPAEAIARAIRAQSRPYPGAFSYLDGEKVVFWRAHHSRTERYFGVPGHVIRLAPEGPIIACGNGTGLVVDEARYLGSRERTEIRYRLGSTRFGRLAQT